MTRRTDDDDHDDAPADAVDPPPGPTDHGRTGGMATREVAPEVVEKTDGV